MDAILQMTGLSKLQEGAMAEVHALENLAQHEKKKSANVFKCALLGAVGSGKSSVIKRLVCHRFDGTYLGNNNIMGMKVSSTCFARVLLPVDEVSFYDCMLELVDQQAEVTLASVLNGKMWYEQEAEMEKTRLEKQHKKEEKAAGKKEGKAEEQNEAPKAAVSAPEAAAAASPASDEAEEGEADQAAAEQEESDEEEEIKLEEVHPVLKVNTEDPSRKRSVKANKKKKQQVINPLLELRGWHTFVFVFDVGSKRSFDEARVLVQRTMQRIEFNPHDKTRCPVNMILLGNKIDKPKKFRQVTIEDVASLQSEFLLQDCLVPEIKHKHLQTQLLHSIEACIQLRLQAEALQDPDAEESASKKHFPGDDISADLVKCMRRAKTLLGLVQMTHKKVTNEQLLKGLVGALWHDKQMGSETWLELQSCDAMSLRYIEISAKTNGHIAEAQKMLIECSRDLPTLKQIEMGHKADEAHTINANSWNPFGTLF